MAADIAAGIAPGAGDRDLAPRLTAHFARELPELAVPWQATAFERPEMLALNEPLAGYLGLDAEWLRSGAGVRFLIGAELAEGSEPVAQAYAGHQFGGYAPRLGDGRALLLGELGGEGEGEGGAAGQLRDLHLKGSGRTPFSRGGDGFAVIGPMLREYLVSEAMHALGVPTTRSLAVVATGGRVLRDDSLDPLPGAVLARVASSHLRVGSLQYARALGDAAVRASGAGESVDGEASSEATDRGAAEPRPYAVLEHLIDVAIERHLAPVAEGVINRDPSPALRLLAHVIAVQARTVAAWMCVGFVHGVMNTDNMTLSGETIDYGPCAFIDATDAEACFSSIDHQGRYAFGRQPGIALWNLTRCAEALLPLIADDEERARELAIEALNGFTPAYERAWREGMTAKLGLSAHGPEAGGALAAALLDDLQRHGIDFTGFFRALSGAANGADGSVDGRAAGAVLAMYPDATEPGEWFAQWRSLAPDAAEMRAVNPAYIPRNHLVDEALAAANAGDLAPFEQLLSAVSRPFAERQGFERYALPAPQGLPRHVTYCGT